jgi:hypothetical protein
VKFGDQRPAGIVAAPGYNDSRTSLREGDGSGAADAGQRTGDKDDLRVHGLSSHFLRGRPMLPAAGPAPLVKYA